jgi:hypothetical protein
MIEIKDLLLKAGNLIYASETQKEIIKQSILEVTKISISKKEFVLKNKIIYLNIKTILKNEIFLKKNEILNKLKETLGTKAPIDFR